MSFKDISYSQLWWVIICSVKQNHSCNLSEGHYEEHFCGIIFNLDLWFRERCGLKYFLSTAAALTALLIGRVKPFAQFWKRALWGTFL